MSRMRLEEVTDEYDLNQDGYSEASGLSGSESDNDDNSDYDDDDDEAKDAGLDDESLYDRISALRDIIPPPTRARISSLARTTKQGVSSVALYGGKTLWVITSSLLLLGIPFMMAVEQEAQAQEEEKALQMQAGGNDLLAPGSSSPVFAQPQQAPAGVRPPGF